MVWWGSSRAGNSAWLLVILSESGPVYSSVKYDSSATAGETTAEHAAELTDDNDDHSTPRNTCTMFV